MTERAESHPGGAEYGGERRLWIGVGLPILAWIAALMIGYPVATRICGGGGVVAIATVTLLALLAAAGGTLTAFRMHQEVGREEYSPRGLGEASRLGRRRLMARGGLTVGLLMVGIIVAHGIAVLVLRPC